MSNRVSTAILMMLGALTTACADDERAADDDVAILAAEGDTTAQPERAHDARTFTIDPATLPFDALAGGPETHRWSGVLDGAGYRVEVPKEGWNGILVMYAHGYAGTGNVLRVSNPSIRKHLLAKGYAWAASSYSKNYYDVRAGVEDTNKLALAFTRIAADNGTTLEEPTKRYIIGHSMGGHVTAAAIEKEAIQTAANKVVYQGAVPMCGVMGDVELFDYFTAYQVAAQYFAKIPVTAWPVADFANSVRTPLQAALFSTFPTKATPAGEELKAVIKNLTGGKRPVFDLGWEGPLQTTIWNTTFGGDGRIAGILAKPVVDTRRFTYQLDDIPAINNPPEQAVNTGIYDVLPEANANPVRTDGVRWIPVNNGEIDVPVVSLHTLGDIYVPFSMQQIYKRRVNGKGRSKWLVQRAIRDPNHCGFTFEEQVSAFEAMATWEQEGVKPEGDDVLNIVKVADPKYGCAFTSKQLGPEDMGPGSGLSAARAAVAARDGTCP